MFEHNYVVFERRNIYLYSSLCNPSLKKQRFAYSTCEQIQTYFRTHCNLILKLKKKILTEEFIMYKTVTPNFDLLNY